MEKQNNKQGVQTTAEETLNKSEAFFLKYKNVIIAAVVALIAAPVFFLARKAGISWRNCWIPILSALLIWLFGLSPVLIILSAIALGLLYSSFSAKK